MSRSKKIVALIFFLILVYAVWNGRNFILGPIIVISSPLPGETITNDTLEVTGNIKNASFITLDGRNIFVDKMGNFSEDVLVLPGLNILEISAKDRFGKIETKRVSFYKKE